MPGEHVRQAGGIPFTGMAFVVVPIAWSDLNAGGWSTQIGLHDIGSEVTEFLRHDGERQAVFGVVHEFPHPLLGVAVAVIAFP